MALVQTPRAVLLQQTSRHRVDPVLWHAPLGRYAIWCAVFLPRFRSHSEPGRAEIHGPRSGRASGFSSSADYYQRAANERGDGVDDHRSALGGLLDMDDD